MRKNLLIIVFSFLLLAANGLFAQTSSVVVTPLTADYNATPPTVTFKVTWPADRDADHRSKVWVLVDYRRIQNNAYVGDWLRAGISTAQTPTATAGTVSLAAGNTKGFWLQGTNSAFTATVTVPVIVNLTGGYAPVFGWCGVALDRPPTAVPESGGYTLQGTSPFIIQTDPVNTGSTVSHSNTAYNNCIYGLTDATGCPGEWPPMPAITGFNASTASICAGQSVTLTAAATNAERYSFDNGATWGSSASTVVSPATTTTYILKATRTTGACTVTSSTQRTITVRPVPELEFVNPPAGLCAGSEATLTVNDKNNAGSSYCFTYECTDCVHNGYLTGNEEPAAAACQWYSECVYSEANTYTVTMPDAGTFTIKAKAITAHGCVDSVTTTIAIGPPMPTITLASGSSALTVTAGESITEIKYTTSNATSVTPSNLPDGVSGAWSSNVYTITGTPIIGGTYNYTVTTTNGNGCPDVSADGTITVKAGAITYTGCTTPTLVLTGVGFANSTTYPHNGITLSAPVTVTTCQKTTYSGGSTGAYQADCRTSPGYAADLFSWCMVKQYASELCPSPWRVPTRNDICKYAGFGDECTNSTSSIYAGIHGWLLGGRCSGNGSLEYLGRLGYYWSSSEDSSNYAYYGYVTTSEFNAPYQSIGREWGASLRCVR
jgi:hypothetical protein